jgi:hypothetical protein
MVCHQYAQLVAIRTVRRHEKNAASLQQEYDNLKALTQLAKEHAGNLVRIREVNPTGPGGLKA